MEEKDYLRIPGHISVEEAADKLGLSKERVLQHVRANELLYRKVANRYMISEQALEEFHSKPHGRIRTKPVLWRAYRAGAKVRAMHIEIQVQPNQQAALQVKLQTALDAQEHLFPGTMQRYIFAHSDNPNAITIQLIWKDIELPDETTLQRDLEAFRAEFADLLDWQTARYTTMQALIHT
ncbi:MAG: helix-turn-helix domain-containing protein [Ktedonobacteraceae bacterium]